MPVLGQTEPSVSVTLTKHGQGIMHPGHDQTHAEPTTRLRGIKEKY